MEKTQVENDFISELLNQQQEIHQRAVRIIEKKEGTIRQLLYIVAWLKNRA
jgi:hypothetical protein